MAQPDLDSHAGTKPSPPPSGMTALLGLLSRLVRRRRRGERMLPLIDVVHPTGTEVAARVRRQLARPRRRHVPHVLLDESVAAGADVQTLLDRAHRTFAFERFGRDPLRFRHYPLARWLMRQTVEGAGGPAGTTGWIRPDPDDPRGELARRLRRRSSHWGADASTPRRAESGFSAVYGWISWLVRHAVPTAVYRVAVSGRFRFVGREYWWFMRQPYLAPRQSRTFLDFAGRLTVDGRTGELRDEVTKLLVHAFLEDLRFGYRRRPWHLRGWRRTVYPVLILDGVRPGTPAETLIQLVNDVRNETGRWDPLLVLATRFGGKMATPEQSDAVAARPGDEQGAEHRSRLWDIETGYDAWQEALPDAQRRREPDAWILAAAADERPGGRVRRATDDDFVVPPPPWFARRTVVAAVALALLVGLGVWVNQRWGTGCHPHPLGGTVAVRLVDGQCVGYSDSASQIFSADQRELAAVQRLIFRQNELAEQTRARKKGAQPLVTLVYLGALTGQLTGPTERAYAAEREELEGLAVAQRSRLPDSGGPDGAPLLRIVVANAGNQMRYAEQAVDLVADLAASDPTVVGVVGLVESRTWTARALQRLNRAGLPAIATTLSADGFSRNSRLYLQLGASNAEEVELVARYAERARLSTVHLYYSTGGTSLADDRYVGTLTEDAEERFGVRAKPFRARLDLSAECDFDGLLFFTGRFSDFDEFLDSLKDSCVGGRRLPVHLVADDSVGRYVANRQKRRDAPDVPLMYVSKAALATCARLRTATGNDPRATFYRLVQRSDLLQPPRCVTDDGTGQGGAGGATTDAAAALEVGERVALAYDAAEMFLEAVQRLSTQGWDPATVSPAIVFNEIMRNNVGNPYLGVSGPIRLDPDTAEPIGKWLSLISLDSVKIRDPADLGTSTEILHCGTDHTGALDPRDNCARPAAGP